MDQQKLSVKRDKYRLLLEKSAGEIVTRLLPFNVEKVSLYGSYAKGRADLFTDLDVLVIMDSDKPFVDRVRDIYGVLAMPVDIDILCYTPLELEQMKDTPFMKNILAGEVVLYEKKSG